MPVMKRDDFEAPQRAARGIEDKVSDLLSTLSPNRYEEEKDTTHYFLSPAGQIESDSGLLTRLKDHVRTAKFALENGEDLKTAAGQQKHIQTAVLAVQDVVTDFIELREKAKKILKNADRTQQNYEQQADLHQDKDFGPATFVNLDFKEQAVDLRQSLTKDGELRGYVASLVTEVGDLARASGIPSFALERLAEKFNSTERVVE